MQSAFGVDHGEISKTVERGLQLIRSARTTTGLNAPGAAVRRSANTPMANQSRYVQAKAKLNAVGTPARTRARENKARLKNEAPKRARRAEVMRQFDSMMAGPKFANKNAQRSVSRLPRYS